MRRFIFLIGLFAAIVGTANLLTSCKEDSSATITKDIIGKVEKKIPLEETPNLGIIPSLQLQYKEAKNILDSLMRLRSEEAKEKFKEGSSMEDAIRQAQILSDEKKAMKKELEKFFKERIMVEAKKLDGKVLDCKVDEGQYSEVKAKLVCAKDSSILSPFNIEVEATLKRPFRSVVSYCEWQYQDAHGGKLQDGAMSSPEWIGLKAGDKLSMTFPIGVQYEKAMAFKRLYFHG